jgi:hypothetical protein
MLDMEVEGLVEWVPVGAWTGVRLTHTGKRRFPIGSCTLNKILLPRTVGLLLALAALLTAHGGEVGQRRSGDQALGGGFVKDKDGQAADAKSASKDRARTPGVYPSQTAIEGLPWVGAKPASVPKATWKLRSGPNGLEVDGRSGQALWRVPAAGFHSVAMTVSIAGRELPVEWHLRVVPNDVPGAQVFSTQYLDYVFPAKYVDQMAKAGLAPVIDAAWERMRDLLGVCPANGKQAIKYGPDMGGRAHSGNPVMIGPGWFNDDPVESWGWMLHIPIHEFGHNFHGMTRIAPIISGQNPPLDRYFHHGMELTEVAMMTRIAQSPEQFGLTGLSKTTYLEYYRRQVKNGLRRAESFRKWLASGNDPAVFKGDTYGVGEAICYELCDRFGPQALERTMQLFRHDALGQKVYDSADTDVKRQTLLWCMFSCAADEDLRPYFRSWGFKADDAYFTQTMPIVRKAVANLPAPRAIASKLPGSGP